MGEIEQHTTNNLEHHRNSFIGKIRNLFLDNSLTKKASLNALAGGLEYASRLIVGFIITPILVAGLGDYFYGAYQVLTRLLGYLSPASGRPTQALKMKLANQQLIAADDEKRKYIGSTIVILLLFLPVTIVGGGIITWFAPYWLKATPETYWIIRVASAVFVFQMILGNFSAIPRSALEGENLGYKRMGLSTLLIFVGGGLTWLAMWLRTGLVGVAVSSIATSVISGLFYLFVVRTYAPWFGVKKASRQENKDFLGLSVWFMLWNLVNLLIMASDVVVLGLVNSVQSVTDYTLTKYAPETTINVIATAVFSILPGLGGIIGSGDLARAARVRSEIMSFTWWTMTVFGGTILLWNQHFLALWVGSAHFPGNLTNLLVILTVSQFVIFRNDANVIDLTLKLKQKVLLGFVSVAISIGLAIVFLAVFNMGIPGMILGVIIGRVVLSIAYPLIVGRLINVSWIQQIKGVIRPVLVTALIFTCNSIIAVKIANWKSMFANSWIGLILSVGFTFLVLLVLSFFLGFNREQQIRIWRRIEAIISTRIKKE